MLIYERVIILITIVCIFMNYPNRDVGIRHGTCNDDLMCSCGY